MEWLRSVLTSCTLMLKVGSVLPGQIEMGCEAPDHYV